MRFHDWFKLNHQWKDIGKPIKIGKYACTLYWDEEKRHYRVELEGFGNVGRSKESPEDAIIDAKGTLLGEDIKIPIKVGDVVLGGKFKNKRITVKSIGKNEKGDITINGKPLLKFRLLDKQDESIRGYPKGKFTINQMDNLPRNSSGFANTIDHYLDPLDPRKKRYVRKSKWAMTPKRGREGLV